MPKCNTGCEPRKCPPRFITVQQPPRCVVQKKVIMQARNLIDHKVLPCKIKVTEPKLIYVPRTITIPYIYNTYRTVKDPKIMYVAKVLPNPSVVQSRRIVTEPHEICQSMLCQPKPQIVQIPPPPEYNCYKVQAPRYNCKPPVPCSTSIQPCTQSPPGCTQVTPYVACNAWSYK